MAKNREDWAIVVGVQEYPDPSFGPLRAPENDARAFYEWLVSDTGGKLLKRNAKLILSSNYKQPFNSARSAKPTAERIAREFEKIDAIYQENNKKGLGRRVGRRLYLYFAGHGCAPQSPVLKETLFMTANVYNPDLSHNIPGKMYADLYFYSAHFDEVVLVMDCCREVVHTALIRQPARTLIPPAPSFAGKLFVAYACKWNRKARERPFKDGNGEKDQGVFTKALLAGLNGAGSDPEDGRITAASLLDYLYTTWKHFLLREELEKSSPNNPPQEPEIWFDPQKPATGDGLVFATVAVPTFPVTVSFPAALEGKMVKVTDGSQVLEFTTIHATPWQINLKRGKYLIEVPTVPTVHPGKSEVFDVLGVGETNVNVLVTETSSRLEYDLEVREVLEKG